MKVIKSNLLKIILALLLVLTVVFFAGASKAASKNNNLKNELADAAEQKAKLEDAISELDSAIGDSEVYSELMDGIQDFMSSGNAHDTSKNIYAERNIVVVKKGSSDKIRATISTYDELRYKFDDGTIASVSSDDKWEKFTLPITIKGLKVGTTVLTLYRGGSEDEFHVLVVVIP